MPSVAETMRSKVGWDEGYARRVRLITGLVGLLLLFAGVVCQWWAGNNIADLPLATLCEAYSGVPDVMGKDDFMAGKLQFYERYPNRTITLEGVAFQFVGESYDSSHPTDAFLYSNPAFWCKRLPSSTCTTPEMKAAGRTTGTECEGNVVKSSQPWVRLGAWPGRQVSEKPSWALASGVARFTSTRIRCKDKAAVYKGMLETILTDAKGEWIVDERSGSRWSQEAVNIAADEMLYSCMRSKGSTGYILALGPLLSSMTSLICLFSLCRWFQGPTTASAAEGFAIVSVALTLVGFWVINFRTDNEFLQAYMICGGSGRRETLLEAPYLVSKGVYFDSTPCMDIDSEGERHLNPYVRSALGMTAVYTSGGICNLIATILLLVSVSKVKEQSKLTKFQTLEASDEL